MERDEIKIARSFNVVYRDNFFTELHTIGSNTKYVFKNEELPNNTNVGDIITKYINKTKQTMFYEITQENNLPPKTIFDICIVQQNSLLFNNKDKPFDYNTFEQDNNVGYYLKNSFYKDQYLTNIFFDLIQKHKIKKIKNFHISKWVVRELYNHTVCLYNLFNFDEKRYISDLDLELNSRKGDIYYYIEIGNNSTYMYDEQAGDLLQGKYWKLFCDNDNYASKNKQQKPSFLEQLYMQKIDTKNAKLFNKTIKHEFIEVLEIVEDEGTDDPEKRYRIESITYPDNEDITLGQSQLPKHARVGDIIGRTKEGKFEFDRVYLCNFINEDFEKQLNTPKTFRERFLQHRGLL